MRRPRLKIIHQPACYHVICRITQGQLWLGDQEKVYLTSLLHRVARYCGVEVLTFCIMSNHFHLLVRIPEKAAADAGLTGEQLIHRVANLYGSAVAEPLWGLLRGLEHAEMKVLWEAEAAVHRGRMHDLSIFMKLLKQRFTMWHNHGHGTRGTLWSERFKSVVIEARDGERNPVQLVAAYIDLNPVRAGVVAAACDYPFSGCGSAAMGNVESQRGQKALTKDKAKPETSSWYEDLLNGLDPATGDALRQRQEAFIKGIIVGSATFVMEVLQALIDIRRSVRPQAYATGGLGGSMWVGHRFRSG